LLKRIKIPSAFNLALSLLIIALALAWAKGLNEGVSTPNILLSVNKGLWDKNGLVFMVQMVFMLLLGQSLAKTPQISRRITKLFSDASASKPTYVLVAFISLLSCWVNWGLGLVLGALAANIAARELSRKKIAFNYGFLAALGYSGMMIWHSGLSGSSTLKAAEKGSITAFLENPAENFPTEVFLSETVFSFQNIFVSLALTLAILVFARYVRVKEVIENIHVEESHSNNPSKGISAIVLGVILAVALVYSTPFSFNLSFLNPNFINSFLLITLLFVSQSLDRFTKIIEDNLKGSSGILLQFPIYFAIMAILKDSGLLSSLSATMLNSLPKETIEYSTFISAAAVNFMVPSGGGQWLIQGPIIANTFVESGANLPKGILAFAYGDALTNMLQPFWALPLLGITRLKISDLLPHTFKLFCIGFLVFSLGILLF
jgi:short-chain fatty acids transporter